MRFSILIFIVGSLQGFAQSLSSLNFNYWYDPNNEIEFNITPVNVNDEVFIYYQLMSKRKENSIDNYKISWEKRGDMGQRNGEIIAPRDSIIRKTVGLIDGLIRLPGSSKIWFIAAKIVNSETQNSFYFYKPVDPLWPLNTLVKVDDNLWSNNYIPAGKRISLGINSEKKFYCFQYKNSFSAALPPFAEPTRSDPFLEADSVFEVGDSITPTTTGLYLFQHDTTSAKGFSFLVTPQGFPKHNTLFSLAGPLVYISTDDEYQRLLSAKNDKPAFDRIILEITRDKERAKNLMRSYFQRVETANYFFSEYKEGWKTDRGMIYIVYGLPDEVSRTATNEIWYYKNYKTKFVFVKSGSVFSPESYKLQRENQYMAQWFSLVDLWRKSRF